MGQEGDLEGLLGALRYSDKCLDLEGRSLDMGWRVRLRAAEVLAELREPAVADGLSEALADPHPGVRSGAVKALANLGVPKATEALLDCVVGSEQRSYGETAREALETVAASPAELLPEAFIDRLAAHDSLPLQEWHREAFDVLLEGDPRGRKEAAGGAARHLVSKLAGVSEGLDHERLVPLLDWLGPGSADGIIESLEEGTGELVAARAAGELRAAAAVEPLIGLLERPSPELRATAAVALGRVGDTRAVAPLMSATQDPDATVRDAASQALDAMGVAAVILGLAALGREGANGGASQGALESQLAPGSERAEREGGA